MSTTSNNIDENKNEFILTLLIAISTMNMWYQNVKKSSNHSTTNVS